MDEQSMVPWGTVPLAGRLLFQPSQTKSEILPRHSLSRPSLATPLIDVAINATYTKSLCLCGVKELCFLLLPSQFSDR